MLRFTFLCWTLQKLTYHRALLTPGWRDCSDYARAGCSSAVLRTSRQARVVLHDVYAWLAAA